MRVAWGKEKIRRSNNPTKTKTKKFKKKFGGKFKLTKAKMKLVHREIYEKSKDKSGSVTLVPEEMEDMWHIYNLIAVGDYVRASTIR